MWFVLPSLAFARRSPCQPGLHWPPYRKQQLFVHYNIRLPFYFVCSPLTTYYQCLHLYVPICPSIFYQKKYSRKERTSGYADVIPSIRTKSTCNKHTVNIHQIYECVCCPLTIEPVHVTAVNISWGKWRWGRVLLRNYAEHNAQTTAGTWITISSPPMVRRQSKIIIQCYYKLVIFHIKKKISSIITDCTPNLG